MCYCAKFTNYSTVSSAPIIKVLQGFFSCLHAGKKQKKKMKEACFFFLSVHLLLSPDFSLCAGRRETVEWSTAFGEWR